MKFTKNEKYLISGSCDNTVRVWDVVNRKEYWVLPTFGGYVIDVAINPLNPSLFVSASDDKTIKIWNIDNKQ